MSTDCKTALSKIHSTFTVSTCEQILNEYEKKTFQQKIHLVAAAILTVAVALFSWIQASDLLFSMELLTAPFTHLKIAYLAGVLIGGALPVIGLAIATYNYYNTFKALEDVCYQAHQRVAMLNGVTSMNYYYFSGKPPKQE